MTPAEADLRKPARCQSEHVEGAVAGPYQVGDGFSIEGNCWQTKDCPDCNGTGWSKEGRRDD